MESFDILILSVSSEKLVLKWQERLEKVKGYLIHPKTLILTVWEDWKGGAGNGLGTLYAFQKASRDYGINLKDLLKEGASIAMYHTAGKGQRLCPLTSSEKNDKSAVKLAALVGSRQNPITLTILEAVIKQTSLFAPLQKGRLSVFWGDQIFLPSKKIQNSPKTPVAMWGLFGKMPDAKKWQERRLDQYGLLLNTKKGDSQHCDKIDYPTFQTLIQRGSLDAQNGVGISLGSFNLSYKALESFLEEFKHELSQKSDKMDSDPHFWMPATLDELTYVEQMIKKGSEEKEAKAHFQRIQKLVRSLSSKEGFLSSIDIGENSNWWDYGTIQEYFKNTLKLIGKSSESERMRQFFQVELENDTNALLLNCHIGKAKLKNSVLVGVKADVVEAENCILIGSQLGTFHGQGALIYGVVEPNDLKVEQKSVITDVLLTQEKIRLKTDLTRDSKKDWDQRLSDNKYTYKDVYDLNEGCL